MKNRIDKIKEKYENGIIVATTNAAVLVAKRICELYPYIKDAQPHITGIETGMGTWSFNGYAIGFSNEEENKGEEVIFDNIDAEEVLRNGSHYCDIYTNDAITEIIGLVDYLVDVNGLNCSTWQEEFNDKGVAFRHSETSNQYSPFAIPNKKYWTDTLYYNLLIKSKVPVCFIDASNPNLNNQNSKI